MTTFQKGPLDKLNLPHLKFEGRVDKSFAGVGRRFCNLIVVVVSGCTVFDCCCCCSVVAVVVVVVVVVGFVDFVDIEFVFYR